MKIKHYIEQQGDEGNFKCQKKKYIDSKLNVLSSGFCKQQENELSIQIPIDIQRMIRKYVTPQPLIEQRILVIQTIVERMKSNICEMDNQFHNLKLENAIHQNRLHELTQAPTV